MYEELVQLLKDKAARFDYDGWVDTAVLMEEAANVIEELSHLASVQPHGRLIDADELKKNAYPFPCAIGTEWAVTLRQIDDAPTIIPANPAEKKGDKTVVPVVRCGECEYWQSGWKPTAAKDGTHFCAIVGLCTSADWFCADGERKDGDGDV